MQVFSKISSFRNTNLHDFALYKRMGNYTFQEILNKVTCIFDLTYAAVLYIHAITVVQQF